MGTARAFDGRLRRSRRSVSTWRKGAASSSEESVPRPVLRRADGWWDVAPGSTASRAPQVLLGLTDVHDVLSTPQLAAPEPVEAAYREVVVALVTVLACLNQQVTGRE